MTTLEALEAQLAGLDRVSGITPVDILLLPEALRPTMRKMLRKAIALPELAGDLHLQEEEARQLAEILVQKGFLKVQSEAGGAGVVYKVHFARMPGHNLPPGL